MAKRRGRKATRRRRTRRRESSDADRVVGFFALNDADVFCDGDACIITATSQAMQRVLKRLTGRAGKGMHVHSTTFGEIWTGLQMGAA